MTIKAKVLIKKISENKEVNKLSIEKLEKIRSKYVKIVNNYNSNGAFHIGLFMLETIETFKEFRKGSDTEIKKLKGRVKRLEQQGSYYPTVEEISSIKVGGTDD